MSTIIRITDEELKSSPVYAEWKARADRGAACDYQQPFLTNTDYTDVCTADPVIRWEGQREGRSIRTSYCAECAASESPPPTWSRPVVLTILPGCPDGVRAWAEERERVIRNRVEGTSGADWRATLVNAVEAWIDKHIDQDPPLASLLGARGGTEAIELAIADAVAERRRQAGEASNPPVVGG